MRPERRRGGAARRGSPGNGATGHDPVGERLGRVLVGGLEPAQVVIVDYDASWPERFAIEARHIRKALGSRVMRIEHVGSTAVPGLIAKPIIDVLITVVDPADEQGYAPCLEALGYSLRVREEGHRMFRTAGGDVQIHVYADGNAATVSEYLELRDWLRTHQADRAVYGGLKRRLAQLPWRDMNYYAAAKTDVIAEIMRRARADRLTG